MEKILLALFLTLALVHVGSCAAIKAQHNYTDTGCVECMNLTANSPCNTSTLRQVYTILDETKNNLLVGSTECLYVLDKNSTTWSSFFLPLVSGTDCPTIQTGGISVEFLCKNYIRFGFEVNSSSTTFRVCGTYDRQNPRCWVCTRNGENLSCDDGVPTRNMPSDPIRNHTAQLIVNNDSDDFFFVTSRESFTNEDVIFSTVNAIDVTQEDTDSNQKETWLNTPNQQEQSVDFVGESIEYGPYIYFFFRERALEHYLPGKVIYSRVARICKNDGGGVTNPLGEQFTTFLKTRLICSSGTDYPFIYDSVQDVKQAVYNSSIVYGLFTTTRFRQSSTAICRYDLEELDSLFSNDDRRGQATTDRLWAPITSRSTPGRPYDEEVEKRARMCKIEYSFDGYNYLRDYPLLNINAQNCGLGETCSDYTRDAHDALVVLEGIRAQQIAVISDSNDHIDAYVGTNYRTVYRMSITSTEALIKEKVKICSCDLSSEEVKNRYPYAVSSLEARVRGDGVVYGYGTLDNCVFMLTPDLNSSCCVEVKDRTSQDNMIANHTTKIDGAVTNIFKIFEASSCCRKMSANFTEDLAGRCNQTLFPSQANNKQWLHVHCVIESVNSTAELQGTITVTCSDGCQPLIVPVTIAIDDSDLPPVDYRDGDYKEVERIDQEMADYRHKFKQRWILSNVTCPSSNTCPSGRDCTFRNCYVEP